MRRGSNWGPNTMPDGSWLEVNDCIRELVRDLPVPAVVVDLEGYAWIWNAAAELLFPPPPQTSSATRYPLFSVGAQPWFAKARRAVQLGRRVTPLAWRIRGLGGARFRLGVSITPLHGDDGTINALLALLHDTTAQDRKMARARTSSRWRRCILDALPDAVVVHRAGEIAYANRTAVHLFGAGSARELVGCRLDKRVFGTNGDAHSPLVKRAFLRRVDGSILDVELHRCTIAFRTRNAAVITIREVKHQNEAVVQRSEKQQSERSGVGLQGVIMLDAVGYVVSWNAGAESLTGFRADEIVGHDLAPIYTGQGIDTDELNRALQFAISEGKYEDVGWKRRKDGSQFWCRLTVSALFDRDRRIDGFAVLLNGQRDSASIDDREHNEDQARQAQRMEAIGRLAGGIAHDFNNLLTAIQGHVQFLLDDLPADHPCILDAAEIKKSADRATSLTKQLLAFSRRQELQPRILSLNEIIDEMQTLLRRVISEDIFLQTVLEAELWPVRADPGQIEQVIMNLVVNARDAIPRGGNITIRTSNAELDEHYADQKPEVGPGPYVLLTVSDTGLGMDRETQAHMFEPFFTTKEPGKGTGLGLATVYGIVKQSGGHIWAYSEPGHGTTFKVYLPRVAPTGEVLQRPARSREVAHSGETILLVEDEPAVRSLARRVLEGRGYQVLEAATGEEAISAATSRSGPIHLMLSDVVVPDMNGRRIADQILPHRPDLKLLFMSGYTDEDVKQHGVITPDAPFLEKPFTPDSLARKVREVLDTPD